MKYFLLIGMLMVSVGVMAEEPPNLTFRGDPKYSLLMPVPRTPDTEIECVVETKITLKIKGVTLKLDEEEARQLLSVLKEALHDDCGDNKINYQLAEPSIETPLQLYEMQGIWT